MLFEQRGRQGEKAKSINNTSRRGVHWVPAARVAELQRGSALASGVAGVHHGVYWVPAAMGHTMMHGVPAARVAAPAASWVPRRPQNQFTRLFFCSKYTNYNNMFVVVLRNILLNMRSELSTG